VHALLVLFWLNSAGAVRDLSGAVIGVSSCNPEGAFAFAPHPILPYLPSLYPIQAAHSDPRCSEL